MGDKLIELLRQIAFDYYEECVRAFEDGYKDSPDLAKFFADHLLANGVIVPPCKVGQICYKVWNGEIREAKVVSICYEPLPAFTYIIRFDCIGVLCFMADGSINHHLSCDNIFLTREQAEKALAERR